MKRLGKELIITNPSNINCIRAFISLIEGHSLAETLRICAQEMGIGPAALHRRLCVADRQLLGYLDGEYNR